MTFYCTDYSSSEDWTAGERTYTYNAGSITYLEAAYVKAIVIIWYKSIPTPLPPILDTVVAAGLVWELEEVDGRFELKLIYLQDQIMA